MRKYYIYIIVIFCVCTLMISSLKANVLFPLIGKLIIIDPGHGGKDPGTTYGDILEKDLNLELSNILKTKMESYGASVIMTRYGDYDLSFPNAMFRKKSDFDNRILLINSSKSDMYISIHLNYLNDSRYSGVQVFYDGTNKKIALVFQQNINIELKNDKKIKGIPKNTYMYDKLQIPGILIECGFLSNAIERQKLLDKEYQIQLTNAIANSVVTYFT